MAEEKKSEYKQSKEKPKTEAAKPHRPEIREESLVRVLSTDLPGNKKVFVGLTRIKGVSWSFANAACRILKIDKNRKISELTKQEIDKLSEFIKNPSMPVFLLNRRKDRESGNSSHVIGGDLDMRKEFDIKRLKKIRSYKGWRHALGQPVRGQRTKSHFRKKGKKKAVGVMGKPKPGKK